MPENQNNSVDTELAIEKLSRQVGTSVAVLRETYVHIEISEADWEELNDFGASGA